MDKAFAWLMVFVCSQIVIMTGGLMLGTLNQSEKNVVQNGQAAVTTNVLPWLIVEGIVIFSPLITATIKLLKSTFDK